MTLIQQGINPAEYVPKIFSNHCGVLPWSGREASSLLAQDMVSILEYCRAEGSRQGWNDTVRGSVGYRQEGPFHPDLLGGFPAEEWGRSYLSGIEKCRDAANDTDSDD